MKKWLLYPAIPLAPFVAALAVPAYCIGRVIYEYSCWTVRHPRLAVAKMALLAGAHHYASTPDGQALLVNGQRQFCATIPYVCHIPALSAARQPIAADITTADTLEGRVQQEFAENPLPTTPPPSPPPVNQSHRERVHYRTTTHARARPAERGDAPATKSSPNTVTIDSDPFKDPKYLPDAFVWHVDGQGKTLDTLRFKPGQYGCDTRPVQRHFSLRPGEKVYVQNLTYKHPLRVRTVPVDSPDMREQFQGDAQNTIITYEEAASRPLRLAYEHKRTDSNTCTVVAIEVQQAYSQR